MKLFKLMSEELIYKTLSKRAAQGLWESIYAVEFAAHVRKEGCAAAIIKDLECGSATIPEMMGQEEDWDHGDGGDVRYFTRAQVDRALAKLKRAGTVTCADGKWSLAQ